MKKNKKRLVVGITGASGGPLAVTLLAGLNKNPEVETHLIISKSAELTLEHETSLSLKEIKSLAETVYGIQDMAAAVSSGTFKTDGMIIAPCSMKTLAAINHGYSENLIHRAADVTIKEKRKLMLVPRETPFSQIHLRNMYELAQMGITIMPLMMSYYNRPQTIQDVTDHIVGKILDAFGIGSPNFNRWIGMSNMLYSKKVR